jgi:hypothetical protein
MSPSCLFLTLQYSSYFSEISSRAREEERLEKEIKDGNGDKEIVFE